MSKRKGLSNEEKRMKMLEIFHETKDFYQLKDLEKIAPKEKGIVLQSVKDVLQSLVDDGLVDSDKIGTSIYYWSYPNKTRNMKLKMKEDLQQQNIEVTKKLKLLDTAVTQEKEARKDSIHRTGLLLSLAELRSEESSLSVKLEKYKQENPETLEHMKTYAPVILEAANRWTDNVFTIKSWCKNKFNIENSDIDKQFRIPGDFDYLE